MPARPDTLFLTQSGPTLPSVRFRVIPYVEMGKRQGLDIDWKQIPKTMARRLPFYIGLPRDRTIVLQKKLLSTPELLFLKSRCQRLVFDFDDAIWTRHPGECDGQESFRKEFKAGLRFRATLGRADTVIAGNGFLAQKAGEIARNVAVLPTPIDTDFYRPPEMRNPTVTIGWMGAACNLFFLPPIFEALGPLPQGTRLLVVSDKPPPPLHPAMVYEKWTPERELEQLQSMDVGLMPLTDGEYTRGKCGFKLLQYLATGAAAVASPVGFNREIVDHGKTGLFASSPGDWAEAVGRLARDPALRSIFSERGRRMVEERFSLRAASEKLWTILDQA